MANITPIQLSSSNSNTFAFAAASGGGDTVINATASPETVLVVNNASGSSITVTLAGISSCNFGVTHNATYTVAANTVLPIKIAGAYINSSNQVGVTYSAVTTVTVAAYKH